MKTKYNWIMGPNVENLMGFCGFLKSQLEDVRIKFYVNRAQWLADTYNTRDKELENLLLKVKKGYSDLSIMAKIGSKMLPISFDLRKEIQKEIDYRKEHIRGKDDWKEIFEETAEIFSKKGIEELALFMRGKAMEVYTELRKARVDSAL